MAAAAIVLYSNLTGRFDVAPDVSACGVSGGRGYVLSLLERSIYEPYQIALLAGLIAVPVHFAWIIWRSRTQQGICKQYADFATWAQTLFTSLGFLGTIVGVSLAVGGLEAAMSEGETRDLVCGLSIAFDTTFLGLSGAILLLIGRRMLPPRNSDEQPG